MNFIAKDNVYCIKIIGMVATLLYNNIMKKLMRFQCLITKMCVILQLNAKCLLNTKRTGKSTIAYMRITNFIVAIRSINNIQCI